MGEMIAVKTQDSDVGIDFGEYKPAAEQIRAVRQRGLERAGIPRRFRGGFETYRSDRLETATLRANAMTWVNHFVARGDEQTGLAMIGSVGCGKTHLACVIACEIQMRNLGEVRFANVGDLFCRIQSNFKANDPTFSESALFDDLVRADLVVLDDLGVEPMYPWVLSRLYWLINALSDRMATVIFTSNLGGEELTVRLSGNGGGDYATRIVSRLNAMVEPLAGWPAIDFRFHPEALGERANGRQRAV